MENEHTINGLIRKRATIAGQIEHLQDQLRALVIDLDNVDHVIHMFDPTIELEEISKRPVPPRHQAFKGEVTRIVLATLKNAKKPLTSAEIAQRVMAERGLDTQNANLLRLMCKRVGACLRHWEKKGALCSEWAKGEKFKHWKRAENCGLQRGT